MSKGSVLHRATRYPAHAIEKDIVNAGVCARVRRIGDQETVVFSVGPYDLGPEVVGPLMKAIT